MVKPSSLKPVLASLPSATLASLCCLLPLVVVLLGLGSGAFMMYTMRYSYVFIPLGVTGVGLAYFFYFRERKQCHARACQMASGRLNLAVLVAATLVVVTAILFNMSPELFGPLFA